MATTNVIPNEESIPTNPTEQTPQTQARESVQEKYDRLYNQTTSQTPVVTTPVVETTPTTVVTPPISNEVVELLKSLRGEIDTIKAKVAPPTPDPVLTPWFEHLRQGDFEGAETDLKNRIRAEIFQEITQKTTSEATQQVQLQVEIDRFLNDLRGQNPDIIPMESYLTAPVQRKIEAAQKEGKVKTYADYLSTYKEAVNGEVENLRKITQQYRAVGAQAATTRTNDVRNAATLTPQAINSENQDSQTPGVIESETPMDYFAKRKQMEQVRHGMSV